MLVDFILLYYLIIIGCVQKSKISSAASAGEKLHAQLVPAQNHGLIIIVSSTIKRQA
jgi:hypothetical protein